MGPDPMTDHGLETEQRWDVKDLQSNRGIEEVEDKKKMCLAKVWLIYWTGIIWMNSPPLFKKKAVFILWSYLLKVSNSEFSSKAFYRQKKNNPQHIFSYTCLHSKCENSITRFAKQILLVMHKWKTYQTTLRLNTEERLNRRSFFVKCQ